MLASLTTFFFFISDGSVGFTNGIESEKIANFDAFCVRFSIDTQLERFRLLIEWNHLANKSRTENSRGGKKRARQTKTNLGISAALFFFSVLESH